MEKDKLMEMKLNSGEDYHRFEADNIAFKNELMVTITLAEYRALVFKWGKYNGRLEAADNERWKAIKERDELKKRVAELEGKLNELKGVL